MTGKDELEQALSEVRSLIDSIVAKQGNRGSRRELITQLEPGVVVETAQALAAGARTSIDVVQAAPLSRAELAQHPSERAVYKPRYEAGAQVRIRVLTTPAHLDEEYVKRQSVTERPAAIRVSQLPPLQGFMVDERAALVITQSAAGRRSSVVRVPEVLLTLRTLFEGVWTEAVPLAEHLAFEDHAQAVRTRRVLVSLGNGVTDEVAARELNVSVRTYRRYVAEVMAQLGVSSRFQAGFRAVELGLLPSGAR